MSFSIDIINLSGGISFMTDTAFLFTLNPDGSAIIGYEDYDVDIFDGDDYEVTYLLDDTNFTNLLHHLNIPLNRDTKNY